MAERSSLLFVCLCEEPSVAVCVIAVFAVCVAALVFAVYIVVCTTLACMIVCLMPNFLLLLVSWLFEFCRACGAHVEVHEYVKHRR